MTDNANNNDGEVADKKDNGLDFEPGPNHEARLEAVLAAIEAGRNPFLEASSVLLRTLAELPKDLTANSAKGLHDMLVREVQTYTRLCEQTNLRRDHMLAVRYALCTALDELIGAQGWAGGSMNETGAWSQLQLLHKFHGEGGGGKTVFLLIGRLANAPDEHIHVLEVLHHILCLGYKGLYATEADGHRVLETIRHRLYVMVAASKEPVPRELAPHWKGAGKGKFRLLRSVPVWVTASLAVLILFGQFSWYKYHLLTESAQVQKDIDALSKLQPPPAVRKAQQINLPQLLQAEIKQGRVSVTDDERRALIVFKGDGMFSGGLDTLSPPTLAVLEKVALALQQVDGDVRVVGHTDNQPIATARFPNNQVLSEKRAQAVQQTLVTKGLPATRITAQGKGDTEPVASNNTAEGRGANRRVEIELVYPGSGAASAAPAPAASAAPARQAK